MMKVLRSAYIALVVGALTWVVINRWDQIVDLTRGARAPFIALSFVSSFGLLLIGSWFWVAGLDAMGRQAPFATVLKATCRTLLARYVPGSVWFAVGRVALLRRAGLPGGPLAATALLEMALTLATVLALGSALLGLAGAFPGGTGWMIAALAVLLIGSSPPVAGTALRWIARKRGTEININWLGYARLIAIAVVFWAWSALTFSLYLRAFPIADAVGALLAAGGFMLAWGVGFLSIIAPQGVGVFEVGLGTVYGVEDVAAFAVIAAGYRLVVLIRDLAATAAAEFISTRSARRESAGTDER